MPPQSIPGVVADFVLEVIESAPAQAELTTLATAGEAGLKDAVATVLKNAKPGGILGAIYPALAGSIEGYVDGLIAKYTPAEIVAFITNEAKLEAKALGG